MPKKGKRESQKDRKKRQSLIEDDNGGMDSSKNEEEKAKKVKTEGEQTNQSGGWFSGWFGTKKPAPVPVEKPKEDIKDKSDTSESEEELVNEKVEEKSADDNEKEESNEDMEKLVSKIITSEEESDENKNSEEESVANEDKSKEEDVIDKIDSEEESRGNEISEEEIAEHEVKSNLESEDIKKNEKDEERKLFINNEKAEKYELNSSSDSENEFLEEAYSKPSELTIENGENLDENIVVAAIEKSHSASDSENEFTIDEAGNGEPTLLKNHVERAQKQNKMKEMTYSSIESENEFENEAADFDENKKAYSVPHSQEKSHSSSESDQDFDMSEINEKKEKETHMEKTTIRMTFWKEAFANMKSDSTWENMELQENFVTMKTKHIDHDEGFGCISNSEDPPTVKGILKETSPFFNNETKMTNFRLSNFHFYSLGFHVSKSLYADDDNESGESVYLFRHFLHIPSLTSQQLEDLRVVACTLDDEKAFDFIKPVWIDQNFICITQTNYNWFQVVSETDHLPVQMNLVPFRQSRQSSWQTIFICPLPPGRHHIQKMLEENPGWRKCGYEEPCVINKGVVYQFFDQGQSEAEACGHIKVECRSEDTLWVKYGQEKWRNQAFITAILTDTDHPEKVVFAGQISLYETLRLEEDLSAYDIQHESMDLSKLDSGVLADLSFPGTVAYVDPFLEYVRQGSLTLSQLSAISAHMGYQKEERLLEDIDMTTTMQDIMENWKDEQGRDASIVNFLTILRKSDVSLTNIAMEIYQNITNSQWI